MRSHAIAGALVALALAGCATTPSTQATEAKGLTAAWAALDAVAITVDGLATSRVLHGPIALQAAQDLTMARDSLNAATAAYKAGQNATADQNVVVATQLVSELVQIAQNPTNGS